MTWNPRYLLWTDIETSGLNPSKDYILEIAMGVAEFKNPFTLVQDKVLSRVLGHEKEDLLNLMDFDVLKMHINNGLIEECFKSNLTRGSFFEIDFRNFLDELGVKLEKDETFVMAGSSCSFDKAFITSEHYTFPLHHRIYDVSSLRLFCHSVGMPEDLIPKIENKKHRAESDLRDSINLGKLCNEWLACSYPNPKTIYNVVGDLETLKKKSPPLLEETYLFQIDHGHEWDVNHPNKCIMCNQTFLPNADGYPRCTAWIPF